MSEPIVSLIHVSKLFDSETKAVKDLSMDIAEGEFLTLLGPSGCGKTTTLRLISGFEFPTSGTIKVQGVDVQEREPYERDVNTVFQNYALFPNMNVFDNIAYGLKVRKVPKAEIKTRVTQMLRLVRLEGYERRRISQMSGGQKQRVAIARALVNRPKVLLLDEPLGALDLQLRKQMQLELKELQKKLGLTFVYVTHDQEEALTMSDRIGVMHAGVLEQLSVPEEIYEHPATRFVASFIGESNIFDGTVCSASETDGRISAVVETACGKIGATGSNAGLQAGATGSNSGLKERTADPDTRLKVGAKAAVSVRPENIFFSEEEPAQFGLKGTVRDKIYIGNHVKILVDLPDGMGVRLMRLPHENLPDNGDSIWLSWDPKDAEAICEAE